MWRMDLVQTRHTPYATYFFLKVGAMRDIHMHDIHILTCYPLYVAQHSYAT